MRHILFVCLVTLGLSGCGEDEVVDSPGPDTSVIMPLAVGNVWQYVYQEFDPTGAVSLTQWLYLRIDSTTIVADETWYVPATVTVALLYINRVDGFWIWPEGDSAALAFKYPAEVGESYDYGGFRMKLTSDNYPVTVSGGTYTCYRYLETHPDIDLDTVVHYYTPGVGLIRRDEIDAVGDSRGRLVVRWSLVDFQLQ